MSIVRYRDQHTPTCDTCGAELQAEMTFLNAVSARREAGWKSVKLPDGTREDICPTCQAGGDEYSDSIQPKRG